MPGCAADIVFLVALVITSLIVDAHAVDTR